MPRNELKVTEQQLKAAKELLEADNPPSITAIARHSGVSRQTIGIYQKRGLLPYSNRQKVDRDSMPEPVTPVVVVSPAPTETVLIENRESEIGKLRTELESIAYANMLDFAIWDGTTVKLKDSAELTRVLGAAIKTVSQTKDGIKIQLHDKLSAITKLLQLFGVATIEDHPTGNKQVTNNFTILLNRVIEQSGGRIDIEDAQVVD